jgi:hypothetical protein
MENEAGGGNGYFEALMHYWGMSIRVLMEKASEPA